MAIALFLGMYLSRVLVLGPLGFLLGFIIAVTPKHRRTAPFTRTVGSRDPLALGGTGLCRWPDRRP